MTKDMLGSTACEVQEEELYHRVVTGTAIIRVIDVEVERVCDCVGLGLRER
jgi:hypothetical protein